MGSIGKCHVTGYKALENVELYAACDVNEKRASEFAEKHGIKHVFSDYNEMLKLEQLQSVSVCTWNNVHAEISIAALKAGKHAW